LIIPQLTYALTILPSPGELFLNDIEKIILNFIWDDKPAIEVLMEVANFHGQTSDVYTYV
jgi:hypothetical protein